jgi:hypothetical protein
MKMLSLGLAVLVATIFMAAPPSQPRSCSPKRTSSLEEMRHWTAEAEGDGLHRVRLDKWTSKDGYNRAVGEAK